MGRREFFGFLAGMAAAAPFAAWMLDPRRGACDSPGAPSRGATPATPETTAVPPVLVFVIPADQALEYDFGRMLGEYLNHGSDEYLAPLAAVEVVCTAEEELPAPDATEGKGPFALRLTRFHPSLQSRELRFALPASHDEKPWRMDRETWRRHTTARVTERIEAVAAAVRRAILAPDVLGAGWPEVASHADGARAVIAQLRSGVPVDMVIPAAGAGEDQAGAAMSTAEVADVAPALLYAALHARSQERHHLMGALAELVRRRLVRGVVPGTEWAVNGGCGAHIEGRSAEDQPDRGIACGMGHVPAESRRFLYFYTARRREEDSRQGRDMDATRTQDR